MHAIWFIWDYFSDRFLLLEQGIFSVDLDYYNHFNYIEYLYTIWIIRLFK